MREKYLKYVERCPIHVSDLSFTNMFAWNTHRDYQFSKLNNNLVIKYTKNNHDAFLPFIGDRKTAETLLECLEYLKQESFNPVMNLVPERIIEGIKRSNISDRFIIEEDRDSFDYVYNIKDLAEMKGKKYMKRRNCINHLIKNHQDWKFKKINHGLIKYCLDFQAEWLHRMRDNPFYDELVEENKATYRAFKEYRKLELIGGAILIKGKVKAFCVVEKINEDTVIGHFQKGDRSIKGTYQLITKLLADKLLSDYRYLNAEQDLGIEGLRFSKQSYRPVSMIKKYTVRLK